MAQQELSKPDLKNKFLFAFVCMDGEQEERVLGSLFWTCVTPSHIKLDGSDTTVTANEKEEGCGGGERAWKLLKS